MKIFLLVILLSMVAVACSPAPAETMAEPPVGVSSDTSDAETQVLRIAAGRSFWQGSATNIYLHFSTNVWESLVLLGDDMEPAMMLASSIEPSGDGLTWTINLREGIIFHDGSAFNAGVAAFNLERLYRFNPATRAFDPEFDRSNEFGTIVDISVISEYSFTVTHAEPVPDFVARIAMSNSAIFAMSSFDEDRVIIHPYGTGPYYYVSYDEQNSIITLHKNINYRLGTPSIDTIYFYNIPDASMRVAALMSGQIDIIADVGGVLPHHAAEILSNPELVLGQRQVSTIHYVVTNSNEGRLFNDSRLRNALGLSIDRDTIVDVLLLGYGSPAISVITDLSTEWVVDSYYRFDPEEAQALVAEAMSGYVPTPIILVNSALTGRWPYQDVAVMLQAQLNEIGISAVIETVDAATWSERMRNSDFDIALRPATLTSGEQIHFFIRMVASTGPDNIMQGYGISNPEMDALITRAATTMDVNARREYVDELQHMVRELDYIIPIWYDVTLYAKDARIQNFSLDVSFRPDLFVVEWS